MKDSYIITPYFFSKPVPRLATLPFAGAVLNNRAFDCEDEVKSFAPLYSKLAEFVEDTLKQGERPVSIAGDCGATIAVVAGLQRAAIDPAIVWLDAHGDFNTAETSPSGFLGGMPLAMIAGLGDISLCKLVGLNPVDDKRIILTDGRDLDPGEAVLVEKSGLQHVTDMADLLTQELPDRPIYVHFDTDVINLEEMYAAAYPAKGGPSAALVTEVLTRLGQSGRVVAASMSCWSPELDKNNQCEDLCVKTFKTLLG